MSQLFAYAFIGLALGALGGSRPDHAEVLALIAIAISICGLIKTK